MDAGTLTTGDVKVTTVLEAIRAAVGAETRVLYARGCDYFDPDRSGFEEAVGAANQADAVVMVLGDRAGLTPDCTCGETRDCADLKLPGVQQDLVRALAASGKPLAAVLITGRPYALHRLAESANAILEAWLPGEEGGPAIADVLFGDANPGGKLPVTFPRSAGQLPIFYNAKLAGTSSHWYGDYVSEKVTPLYPFGHGLSYTQLYIRDEYASTPRPVKELKGYRRLALEPGEMRTITFHLPVDQLAFYDNDLKLVLEPGKVDIMLGSSSQDIRLCGEIEVCGEKKMAVAERVFVCPVSVE